MWHDADDGCVDIDWSDAGGEFLFRLVVRDSLRRSSASRVSPFTASREVAMATW
ncbi:hypothetical protein ABIB15_001316 [Marisediminicola sp. UYEF4]